MKTQTRFLFLLLLVAGCGLFFYSHWRRFKNFTQGNTPIKLHSVYRRGNPKPELSTVESEKATIDLSPVDSSSRREKPSAELSPVESESTAQTRVKILLVTYYRSGSTFVGSLLNANEDIFYMFEPLHFLLRRRVKTTGKVHFLNSTERIIDGSFKQKTLMDILNCRFKDVYVEMLQDFAFWNESKQAGSYMNCTRNNTISACLSELTLPCETRIITAIKTIRLSMKVVEDMIKKDKRLKVLHLIRDPRSTFQSRLSVEEQSSNISVVAKTGSVTKTGMVADTGKVAKTGGIVPGTGLVSHTSLVAKKTCSHLFKDLTVTRRLQTNYPDRVRLLYYEDITEHTYRAARSIYRFLGIRFTQGIKDHIESLRSGDERCLVCIHRSNSTLQLTRWRTQISYAAVKTFDDHCEAFYNISGYLPVKSRQHLSDFSQPLLRTLK